jgi:hypothetical protein
MAIRPTGSNSPLTKYVQAEKYKPIKSKEYHGMSASFVTVYVCVRESARASVCSRRAATPLQPSASFMKLGLRFRVEPPFALRGGSVKSGRRCSDCVPPGAAFSFGSAEADGETDKLWLDATRQKLGGVLPGSLS